MKKPTRVLMGVTGSIAAYKAVELLRLMRRNGYSVKVVMTRAATEFVGELTFRTLSQQSVAVKMFDYRAQWEPEHIALAKNADIMVIAPCTANMIAKIANGIADDLLSCIVLSTTAPLLLAPAMNSAMLAHPATVDNLEALRRRGVRIAAPGTGELACGDEGRGRMAEPDKILADLQAWLNAAE